MAGTVTSSKNLVDDTVPSSKNLVDGTVPSSKNLVDGTPSNSNMADSLVELYLSLLYHSSAGLSWLNIRIFWTW